MPENETDFKLKFDGELNEINASTLGYSLVNITGIIKEIGEEIATAQSIEIKVKATAPGSFLIHLTLQAINDPIFVAAMGGLVSYGPDILKTLTELFKLRKVLKGEPPANTSQDGDQIQVTAGDNTKVIIEKKTYNFYFDHPHVNEAMAKTFKALESDESISGFEITDAEEKPLFEATRDDFPAMALTTSVPQVEEKDTFETVTVVVVRPSFDRKLKWDVVYKGIRITCSMKDQEFQARVQAGERFGIGDMLTVDLRIHQKLDPNFGAYVNKGYEIVRVREYKPRQEQSGLFTSEPREWITPKELAAGRRFLLDEGEPEDDTDKNLPPKPKLSD